MPKVNIDGREIEVPKGTTILQAAEHLGLEVPQMCYHPGLSIVGVCRVCLCRVKGNPKMSPACATEVADGMEVGLYTQESEKARRAVIEFWLLNHPLDCPVCDQGGECPLQDIAFDHGSGTSRLNDPKLKKSKRVVLGPHVILDEERCILCWRCTRFTQEVSQSHQIMLKDRGVYTTVGTPPDQSFDDPYSGNVVDLCPVGALTSRDFRFRSRIWEMASTKGVCTACSVGCNTYVWSKKDRVERLTARPNPEVNEYWLCDRGRFDLDFANDERRFKRPRLRIDGRLTEVEWPEAIGALAKGLETAVKKGRNAVGALFSRHLANEEYWALQRFVRGTLGSNHLVSGRDEILNPGRVDLARSGKLLTSISEIEEADGVLIVGGDLEETHPVFALRIRKAVLQRQVPVFIVASAPGRLESSATRVQTVSRDSTGEWVEALGDRIRTDDGEGWAGELRGIKNLVVLVNAGDGNTTLVGAIRKFLDAAPPDAVWKTLILDDGGNVAGASALGISPGYFPGMEAVTSAAADRWKPKWGGRVHGDPGLEWPGLLEAAGRGELAAMLLLNSGRPANWNFTGEETAAIGKSPFVVAFDLFDHELQDLAHLILPAPSFAEMDATYTAADGAVQLARRNITPKVPTVLHVLHHTTQKMGGKGLGVEPIGVFRNLARELPGYAGLDYAAADRGEARNLPAAMAGAR